MGFSASTTRPQVMPRPHWHNQLELNYLHEGQMTYFMGGQRVEVPAMRLALFWGAMPHQLVQVMAGTRFSVLTLPLPWFLSWRLPPSFSERLLRGELMLAEEESRLGEAMADWSTDLSTGQTELIQVVLLEVEATLRRFALQRGVQPQAPSGDPTAIERMCALIARRYREEIRVEDVAGEVGLHPSYAMRLFRTATGTTLGDYILQHRVSHAQRLLAATDDPVDLVAAESGFQSASQFYEQFKRRTGLTPRRYRLQFSARDGA